MSFLIGAANVKIFGKVFHALVRISDDLYIESSASGLVFHAVNSSKSAYACINFKPDFFISFKEDEEKRKVLLKACLMAFRSVPNLEKTVEKCLFDTSSPDYLLLKFFCKHGMIKEYQIHCIDNEAVQGSFTMGGLCKLSSSSRLLQDGIQNFSTSVEELTLTVCPNKVLLRNYVDDEPDPNKVVHTELTLEPEEFDQFEVQQEIKLTFCLKEVKAVLNFCEGLNVFIGIKCQAGGRPVTFSITGLRGVDATFVMATLADRDSQSISSSGNFRASVSQNSQYVKRVSVQSRVKKTEQTNNYDLPSSMQAQDNSDVNSIQSSPSNLEGLKRFALCLSDDDLTDQELKMPDNEDDDLIPSTPPHKKFRSMFLGLSQATYTSMAPDPDEVLVVDSDDERA